MIESHKGPDQQGHRGTDDGSVHQLMAGSEDVKSTRPPSLGKVKHIYHGTYNVECVRQADSPQRETVRLTAHTVMEAAMYDREKR